STVGFLALKRSAPLFVIWLVGPNWTLYVSPRLMPRSTQPPVPGFGGVTRIGPSLPTMTVLMLNTPLGAFLICATLTGPFSPFGSLYLKPLMASPLQKALPVMPLVPCGRAKGCAVGVPPLAVMTRLPPLTVGLPTMVFGLPDSFAFPMIFRLAAVLGFFTRNVLPRIVWSAA